MVTTDRVLKKAIRELKNDPTCSINQEVEQINTIGFFQMLYGIVNHYNIIRKIIICWFYKIVHRYVPHIVIQIIKAELSNVTLFNLNRYSFYCRINFFNY